MQKFGPIQSREDAIKLLNVALEHEWAVSFEYTIHAYSYPKATYFYDDPIMKIKKDFRAQTIQIGIDEMYHALQLGIIITQLGGSPSFKTDEIIRYPLIIDNLKRDQKTEDLVTDLYRTAEFAEGAFPKIRNMILNIAYDEVRHSEQFKAMMTMMEQAGARDVRCYSSSPESKNKPEVQLLHEVMRRENELMHQYLKFVMLFSEHQDLNQRLFKNSIDHMRHWDKNSGILIKLGDVVRIENAEVDADGVEKSTNPMPFFYPGEDRITALESLIPKEEELVDLYQKLIGMMPEGEIRDQLNIHAGLDREHLFTQTHLLENAVSILKNESF